MLVHSPYAKSIASSTSLALSLSLLHLFLFLYALYIYSITVCLYGLCRMMWVYLCSRCIIIHASQFSLNIRDLIFILYSANVHSIYFCHVIPHPALKWALLPPVYDVPKSMGNESSWCLRMSVLARTSDFRRSVSFAMPCGWSVMPRKWLRVVDSLRRTHWYLRSISESAFYWHFALKLSLTLDTLQEIGLSLANVPVRIGEA